MDTQVLKYGAVIPVSRELLADAAPSFEELLAAAHRAQVAFSLLPPEEQARILAEREAAYEARRCTECGCHPDEHGDC